MVVRSRLPSLRIQAFTFAGIIGPLLVVGIPCASAATFAPNTFIDLPEDPSDNYLTLREAVEKANATPGKDVIQLEAGNYELTSGSAPSSKAAYWAGEGALEITDDLSIIGKSGGGTGLRMMLDKSGAGDRFMTIASGTSVEVEAVAFGIGGYGGNAPYGGGIYNNGNLTLRDSSVQHCSAEEAGGAVFNWGHLEIINTNLSFNQAGRFGGAVFNSLLATANLTDSTLNYNDAGTLFGGYGGAACNFRLGQMKFKDSTVYSNHVYGDFGGHGGYGGGVYNLPFTFPLPGLNIPCCTVIVVNGGFANNFAHRLVSPGKYDGFVEDFFGPVWSYYEGSVFLP